MPPRSRLFRVATAGAGLGLVCLFATSRAAAQAPSGLTLHWDAPAECPQAPWMLSRLKELEASAPPRGLTAEGTIVREGKRYRITLVLRDAAGTSERQLDAPSCADLAGAAAVHLALLLHDAAAASGTSSKGAGAKADGESAGATTQGRAAVDSKANARSPAASQAPRSAASEGQAAEQGGATTSARRERAWRFGLVAPLGTLHFGPLPNPAFGVGVGVTAQIRAVGLMLTVEVDGKQTHDVPGSPGYSMVIVRQAGSAAVCYAWQRSSLELLPCASLWLEHVSGRGKGPDLVDNGADDAWWVAPAVAGLARWRWAPFAAVFASLTLRVEGARPRLSITPLAGVVELAPASAALAVGAEWIF